MLYRGKSITSGTAQSWARDYCLASRQRNIVIELLRQDKIRNVKSSVSKWSSNNEYRYNAITNFFGPKNMFTLSRQNCCLPSPVSYSNSFYRKTNLFIPFSFIVSIFQIFITLFSSLLQVWSMTKSRPCSI